MSTSSTKNSAINVLETAFVCYPAKDIKRAQNFYETIVGLTPASVIDGEGSWIEYDIKGSTFCIGTHEGWNPSSDGPSVAFEVDDFEKSIQALKEAGIAVLMGPLETPVCHMALINDTEGNSLFIHKRKS
ncbi:MAG: VOC family protein [Vampirovibrionales bacterium]|nr:VOC family protein [Vampirovibrionales bacterium]